VTVPLPELVKIWTTVVLRIREPGAGSCRAMRPFSMRSLVSVPRWARDRSFFWSSSRAWTIVLPTRSGRVTTSLLSRTWEKMMALRKKRMKKSSEKTPALKRKLFAMSGDRLSEFGFHYYHITRT